MRHEANKSARCGGAACLGATAVRPGAAKDSTAGRYLMPFVNYQGGAQDGTTYRYVRLYTVVSGSIADGINYRGFIGTTRAA